MVFLISITNPAFIQDITIFSYSNNMKHFKNLIGMQNKHLKTVGNEFYHTKNEKVILINVYHLI